MESVESQVLLEMMVHREQQDFPVPQGILDPLGISLQYQLVTLDLMADQILLTLEGLYDLVTLKVQQAQ